jgi:hypothetical protein
MKKLQKEINNVSELDSEIGPLVKPKRRKWVRQQKRRRSNDDTDSDQEPLIRLKRRRKVAQKLIKRSKSDLGWKKKPTQLSRKKRNTPGRIHQLRTKKKTAKRRLFVKRSYLGSAINQA